MRDWVLGTRDGDWVSMGIPSENSYGIPDGVIYGYPVTVKNGKYAIVQTLERTSGNVKKSAQILHFPRPTFYRKLKKFGIKVER